MSDLYSSLLKTLMVELLPSDFFRLSYLNSAVKTYCDDHRLEIWQVYFNRDVLPFLTMDEDKINMADLQTLNNAEIYERYLNGIVSVKNEIWRSFDPGRGQTPQQFRFTAKAMEHLCFLQEKVGPNTSLATKTALALDLKRGRNYVLFAVCTDNPSLLTRFVKNWPYLFYSQKLYGVDTDLTYITIDFVHSQLELQANGIVSRYSISQRIINKVVELFFIPNELNPQGRYNENYSNPTKENILPRKDRDGEYVSFGDKILEASTF